jgi:hypothetical protein
MEMSEPRGSFYDGDLPGAPPADWHTALRRRARLVVLVGSEINLGVGDPYDRLNDASRAGGVVGAQLLLQ